VATQIGQKRIAQSGKYLKWWGVVISSDELSEFPKSAFANGDGMGIVSCLSGVVLSQMHSI
jgi:hypothetical protein